MSSKHPVPTTDTVTFGSGRVSPSDVYTSDYSGSGGEPVVLLHVAGREWKRRPYEKTDGGVTNQVFDIGPTNPVVGDVEIDRDPPAMYQSLTNLTEQVQSAKYAALALSHGGNGDSSGCEKQMAFDDGGAPRKSSSRCKCPLVLLGFLLLAALVLVSGVVAMSSYGLFVKQPSQDDKITVLETQLSASKSLVDELTLVVEELRQNLSRNMEFKNAEIEQLTLQVEKIDDSIAEILATPNNTSVELQLPQTVDLSRECDYEVVETCGIPTNIVTPVDGQPSESLPNFGSCTTSGTSLTGSESDRYIQDAYCAVTDFRDERNPVMATLRHDEDTNTVYCFCFVTALESRRGAVDCSMIVKYCPSIVQVSSL